MHKVSSKKTKEVKKYPKRIWVEAERISETKNTSLCLTRAKIWGYDMALEKKNWVEYKLVIKRKKKSGA